MHLKPINRDVLVIRPTQTMRDWVGSLMPNGNTSASDALGHDESTVYLIKQHDSIEKGQAWLRKNYKEIFAEELYGWWTIESAWPPLTWENFEKFCHYRLFTCIYDTQLGGIHYEDR